MEEQHKEAIINNLSFLCKDVDYSRFRPELIKNKLFPERQLRLMEEKDGNIKLEVFLQVQRRGPTAFRRLIASLAFSGHDESVRALTRNDDSLLMDVANTDSFNPNQDHSFDLTDSPLHPSQIHVEPANVLRYLKPVFPIKNISHCILFCRSSSFVMCLVNTNCIISGKRIR